MIKQQMNENLVSIVIPYYKKKEYILKTINSILNQSYDQYEILIIYDDENFSDLNYLEKLFKSEKKIRIIKNAQTIGAGFSRNRGIDNAKGEFIAFVDADDTWSKYKLENQMNFMKKKNLKFSHTSYEIIDENDKVLGKRISRNFEKVDDLIMSCDIGLSTVILKKEIIDHETRFPNLKTKEDFVLWLKILKKNILIYSLNETLTSWRKTKNSLSSSVIQKIRDAFKVYNYYMKFNFIKSCYYVICLSINFLRK
ncbi:MAG: glycosyl transferase [Flavobacteriaceae bacterium]|nr:glycosyl transferase [Flavobacteriaceae bacterium]